MTGNPLHLTAEQEEQLRERLDAGTIPEDGVYGMLHRLGFGYLCLRPRQPQSSQEAPDALEKHEFSRQSAYRTPISSSIVN